MARRVVVIEQGVLADDAWFLIKRDVADDTILWTIYRRTEDDVDEVVVRGESATVEDARQAVYAVEVC